MIKISVAAHFQAENLKEQNQRCKPLLSVNDDLSAGKCVCHIWRLAIFQNDRPKKIMPLGIVTDERIANGHYYGRCFRELNRYYRNPELLEVPPEQIVKDPDVKKQNPKFIVK